MASPDPPPNADLAPGQIVEAEIEAAEVFGLFCRAAGRSLLVRIPEVSWIAAFCSCRQFAGPGDRVTVRLTEIDPAGRIYGSIRRVHPDPWAAGRLQPGAVLRARVARQVPAADRCAGQPGYLLELLPGAYAMLCAGGLALQPDQRLPVRIASADLRRRAVALEAITATVASRKGAQPMRYIKVIDEGMHSDDWGGDPTYWMELDQWGDAERQIEHYPNGNVISYDSAHTEDEHGALSMMVISGDEPWWQPFVITPEEFERAWRDHRPINREFAPHG